MVSTVIGYIAIFLIIALVIAVQLDKSTPAHTYLTADEMEEK